jgi:hypothetical protein
MTAHAVRRKKPIISRNESLSALFSTGKRRFIISSVIGGVLQVGSKQPTLPKITDGDETQLHHQLGHDRVRLYAAFGTLQTTASPF